MVKYLNNRGCEHDHHFGLGFSKSVQSASLRIQLTTFPFISFLVAKMRLSGDDGLSANPAGPSEATEMRQTKPAFVNPLITRPEVYYGDGPFDPPSSDDEDDLVVRAESDSDAESVSLLDTNRNGPSTPGRAERGEPSPRRDADSEKVRI